MTQRPDEQQDTTDLDELNPHGAGAGVGVSMGLISTLTFRSPA